MIALACEGTPPGVVVDMMTVADLDAVQEIERRSFPTPWSRQAFLTELGANQYACYLVARQDGRVVAYAGMWVIFDEAHVTNVAVHPGWRGQGLGKHLMQCLMAAAAARGAVRMTLEVRRSNLVAQALYAGLGFAVHGIRPGYYTDVPEDAVIMWKEPLSAT